MTEQKFDRSKFQGAKLSKLKEAKDEAKKKDVRLLGSSNGGTRPGFLSVDEGRNEFRMMPPHDPTKTGSYIPIRTATLECEVPEIENGEETGKVVVKNKKIFIATQHGNEELRKLGKDPIELYIKYYGEEAGLIDDKNERQKFLAPVKGFRGKDKKWVFGIMPTTNYVGYALKDGVLGRLELYSTWIKELDKIVARIEEEEEEVLEIDPFSDPNEGYPFTIEKERNESSNKWEFALDRVNPKKRQSWDDFCEENRITDAQLMELMYKDSLYDMYVDVYTKRDFDLAVDGLRRFDKKWKKNIFENEDFLAELAEIEAIVPEPKTKDSDVDEMFEGKKADLEDTSKWAKPKCKSLLKSYIMDAYEGTPEEEDYLQAVESLGLPELRKWAALAKAGEELPELTSNEEQQEESDVQIPDDVDSQEEESSEEDELDNLTSGRRRGRN